MTTESIKALVKSLEAEMSADGYIAQSSPEFKALCAILKPISDVVMVPREFLKALIPFEPKKEARDGPCCSSFNQEYGVWISDGCTCHNSGDAENAQRWRDDMNAITKFNQLCHDHGVNIDGLLAAAPPKMKE